MVRTAAYLRYILPLLPTLEIVNCFPPMTALAFSALPSLFTSPNDPFERIGEFGVSNASSLNRLILVLSSAISPFPNIVTSDLANGWAGKLVTFLTSSADVVTRKAFVGEPLRASRSSCRCRRPSAIIVPGADWAMGKGAGASPIPANLAGSASTVVILVRVYDAFGIVGRLYQRHFKECEFQKPRSTINHTKWTRKLGEGGIVEGGRKVLGLPRGPSAMAGHVGCFDPLASSHSRSYSCATLICRRDRLGILGMIL